jgi:hypothetical protein
MVNYYFLLLLLIIVFTNLYIKYKNNSREYFFNNKKKRRQKRKNKEKKRVQESMNQLEELIKNTNKYMRENILLKKLENYDIDQLKQYLQFLESQEPKYQNVILKEDLAKKISNNQIYIQNLISNIIGKHMDWKYL